MVGEPYYKDPAGKKRISNLMARKAIGAIQSDPEIKKALR
jgi:hypothetical protein